MDSKNNTITLAHITTVPISLLGLINGQVTYMKSRGMDVVGITSPGELADQFADKYQVSVFTVPMTREISPFRDMVALLRLLRVLRRCRPHIVHTHTPKAGLLGILAAWLARVPVRIYQMHGLRYMSTTGFQKTVLMMSERVACYFAHTVICESPSIRQVALDDRLCKPDKMKVIQNGSANGVDALNRFNPERIGEQARQEIRSQYGIPEDSLVMGFIGRIVRDKGLMELAAAWKTLREEFPHLHWLIVGPFEEQDPIPSDVYQLLHHDSRISLTGFVDVDSMHRIYAAIDLLAFPSYREGFGIALLEGAAMQVPIVATQIPGYVDAVEDGVTGTLVPAHDSSALTDALRIYLNDPKIRLLHGQQGRLRVLDKFQPEKIWQSLYQEYLILS